ncbi:hypothetical protein Q8A67_024165 [Cirrhinus molitorella]|uniref:Uncharacterized protein n=1 Tax=Cirrhinus molitorella TaxID=172907 RepID=A0AA88P2Y9_9TELE|nr:hypothetical protein Q8A67_024165 [Cirrhinus molitorella]
MKPSSDCVGFDKKHLSVKNLVNLLTKSLVCVCVDHAGGLKHTPPHHQRLTNALRSSEAVINCWSAALGFLLRTSSSL